jgi:hypothetical protein
MKPGFGTKYLLFCLAIFLLAWLPLKGVMHSDADAESYMKAVLNGQPSACTDTDGQEPFNDQLVTKGSVTAGVDNNKWTFADICLLEDNAFPSRMIRENRCDGLKATQVDITCPRFGGLHVCFWQIKS